MIGTRFDLTGRVALVTGGSKGLGLAMARGFAEAGADLVIASRSEGDLEAAAKAIGGNTRVAWFVADLSRREEAVRLAGQALGAFGRIDILVNNAGSNQPQSVDAIDDEVWDRLIELNLGAGMALSRALVPSMKANRWGRIIHIGSIMGAVSAPDRSAYSSTKAALTGLTRANAIELGPYGITVNCLAPGPFQTDLPAMLSAERKAEMAARTAVGRWGEPDELVGPALLLASEAGRYVTGTTLVVDGGFLARA
ncbi:MAG: SDR family NAD(P)-dependent oxidoreductase [Isosphaeraceae bacterium]